MALFVPADEIFERLGEALRGVEGPASGTRGPTRMFPSLFGRHVAAPLAKRVHLHRGPLATDSGDYDLLKTPLEELMLQNCVSERSRRLGILLLCEAPGH